ncbi:hypothetical protein QA645_39765 [Bradyrhizobium sp. CIAT3101]|uniref:hypothetical protein n=1 Tax=Bradyrhizobium sp. CIAT3101 TaxID=439387 RepID=UPI0024B1D3ED|nr:hypothetical protein [Bradyrhizobium sp. CIAT3101]WFU80534.1 hypothetical protein QA645_39765 [Bradyrhizobium sp. CIAT3101]
MASISTSCLGILDFEREPSWVRPTPQPGSLMSAETYGFPVVIESVKGSTVDRTMGGDLTLVPAYVAAARKLVEQGAVAIGSNCGFAIRYQTAVAAAVDVPVVLSSLVLLPAMLRQLAPSTQIGVVTSDSTLFAEDLLGVTDPAERARIVVVGIEGGNMSRNSAMNRPTELSEIRQDVDTCVKRLLETNPRVGALLFTCTLFPAITPAIRRRFGRPIYDISTACRLALESAVSAGLVHAPKE